MTTVIARAKDALILMFTFLLAMTTSQSAVCATRCSCKASSHLCQTRSSADSKVPGNSDAMDMSVMNHTEAERAHQEPATQLSCMCQSDCHLLSDVASVGEQGSSNADQNRVSLYAVEIAALNERARTAAMPGRACLLLRPAAFDPVLFSLRV